MYRARNTRTLTPSGEKLWKDKGRLELEYLLDIRLHANWTEKSIVQDKFSNIASPSKKHHSQEANIIKLV